MNPLRYALLAFVAVTSWATAQNIPLAISYQAVLTDDAGNVLAPTAPTNYSVEFRIFDAITGGDRKWTEAQGVSVYQGSFSTLLGTGDPVTGEARPQLDTIFDGAERYLEITVIEGSARRTFTPRQQMVATPFAFRAKFAEVAAQVTDGVVGESKIASGAVSRNKIANNAIDASKIANDAVGASEITTNAVGSSELIDGSVNLADLAAAVAHQLVPAGSVTAFAGFDTYVPNGWVLCHGQALNKNTYPHLFTAIGHIYGGSGDTFHVPDYRGMFMRGQGSTTGHDPDITSRAKKPGAAGRLEGSTQADEFKSHSHQERPKSGNTWFKVYSRGGNGSPEKTGNILGPQTGKTGGHETRPKNTYVHYIIKAH